jgi:DNA adenine methylase/adenine-specific DNA-methyltransferase
MALPLEMTPLLASGISGPVAQLTGFPRVRYMGSKYRVVPCLIDIFRRLKFDTALDAFSGSGVVAYALKVLGKQVTANDFLEFPATIARATIENADARLSPADIDRLLSPNADGRDFIQRTFDGLYFPAEDHAFLDAAWSHLETFPAAKRALALAALCLAAARKQPRGVFTVTDFRYDDGRRNLRMSLREQFLLTAQAYNAVVFDNGRQNRALCMDVFALDPSGFDLVYLDPPYAPPRDDNDYIKRYHFLEGLSVYWRGQRIMEKTATKKIAKRFTPFAYKRTIESALRDTFYRFRESIIVLSYSSNSVPDRETIHRLLRAEKRRVTVHEIPHRYSFGTHATAHRREVREYIFVAPQ